MLARSPDATITKSRVRVVAAGDTLHVVTATGSYRNHFTGDFKVGQDGRLEFGVVPPPFSSRLPGSRSSRRRSAWPGA